MMKPPLSMRLSALYIINLQTSPLYLIFQHLRYPPWRQKHQFDWSNSCSSVLSLVNFEFKYLMNTLICTLQGRIQVWADPDPPPSPLPPFVQLNHANSAYFGAISANFPPISTLSPLCLQIVDPALHYVVFICYPWWCACDTPILVITCKLDVHTHFEKTSSKRGHTHLIFTIQMGNF